MTKSSSVDLDADSDEDLLDGFAAGDRVAGLAFVHRFQKRVYGVAVNLLRDPGLADDVAQQAFVRAWKSAATYHPERGSVAGWLLRITRNLAIDVLRRQQAQPVDPDLVNALTSGTDAAAVEDAVARSELMTRVRVAIAALPPTQAKAVLLAAFYGYTAQEIAVSESVPLGTAKTRIRLGLRTLRARLTEMRLDPTSNTIDR
jgi:RNA polymerase sigma factor (sigma-70 family)